VHDEVSDDFDDVAGIAGRVGRAVGVFLPVWLILLLVLPGLGLQAAGSLFAATLVAGAASWAAGRWLWTRRNPRASGETRISPNVRFLIGALFAIVAIYIVLVLVAGN
jgi:hypothetical protein